MDIKEFINQAIIFVFFQLLRIQSQFFHVSDSQVYATLYLKLTPCKSDVYLRDLCFVLILILEPLSAFWQVSNHTMWVSIVTAMAASQLVEKDATPPRVASLIMSTSLQTFELDPRRGFHKKPNGMVISPSNCETCVIV